MLSRLVFNQIQYPIAAAVRIACLCHNLLNVLVILCPTKNLCRNWSPARVVSQDDGGDEDAEAETGNHRDWDQAQRRGGRGQVD